MKRILSSGTASTESYSDSSSGVFEEQYSQYIRQILQMARCKREEDSCEECQIDEPETWSDNTMEYYEGILFSQLIQEIKSCYHVNL